MAVSETMHNSQLNLVGFIKNNPDIFAQTNYDNITQSVQQALQTVASNNEWFVQVYQSTTDYNMIHATHCTDCFTIFDVNNDYNIFIAGVGAFDEPNPSI